MPDRQEYLCAAGEMLEGLFPVLGIGWAALDLRTGEAEVANFPEAPSVSKEVFLQVCREHPLIVGYTQGALGRSRVLRMSDVISDRALHRTRTYQEGLRPLGVDRQFSVLVTPPASASIRGWAMNRGGRDFTDNDVDLARTLQPVLRLLDMAYTGPLSGPRMNRIEDYSLTAREREILVLLGKGLTGVAIGHLLGVSPRTVAKHLEHAYAKLGCTNRVDALRRIRGE
ncbi:response regulator transcription factor [Pseudarthrobacter sulfonivorans]|uniref:response regulator transcription factor n=1 Tax=Pseudarthrobacter sulfonivorans TaxID=121292 RepID=UPI00210486AD|nr:helix-turn-helix transcriptional regulator [Pseudarthrobacter sulfonivorans]